MANNKKIGANKRPVTFYLWAGLAELILAILGDIAGEADKLPRMAYNEVWYTVYITAVCYLFFEYIRPKLSTKNIGNSILLIIGQLFLCSAGTYIWRGIGIGLHVYTSFATPKSHIAADQFGQAIGSMFFFGIVRHIYNYIKLKRTAQQLRIEKQAAELNYLKSQTNPHFLFNTLNNIYSLARDKSDLAPESIMRLSKILRYMLYETSGEFISIEQELKIMGDYIALEKLRYDDSLRVNFNHDIENMQQALPPLLLIPLVENAFKHGVSETRSQPFVDIHLSIKQRQLTFVVKNSTEEMYEEKKVKENIGLTNLRRQLELQYSDFSLNVKPAATIFTATLQINLASHV